MKMWSLMIGKILICNYLSYSLAQYETPLTKNPIVWNYTEQQSWPAAHCKESGQSPINIVTSNVTKVKELILTKLKYSPELSKPVKVNITNSDFTVSLILAEISQGIDMQISGGALLNNSIISTTYSFLRIEFHWPSEHKIDNKSFVLEIFFVYYATKYKNPTEAIGHSDGYVLLSVVVEITSETNPAIEPIVKAVPSVASNVNKFVTLNDPFVVTSILPENNGTYYSYKGSVSKPYCEQIVLFLVFQTPLKISQDQYNRLKNITDAGGNVVARNNRDIQDIGSRTVEFRDDRVCDLLTCPPL